MVGVFNSSRWIVALVRAAIVVGDGRDMHPRLPPAAARPVELVRADVDQPAGMAVVGRVQHDQMLLASVGARQPQCQLIRLAGRVEDKTDVQPIGHQRRQPLGVARQVVVQVARVSVEQRQLCLGGLHHARVAVPHDRHIVVNVEKRSPTFVVQILHPATHKLERPRIGDAQVTADPCPAGGECLGLRWLGCGEALGGNAEDQIWIRREARPDRALAGIGHAGEIAIQVEQVSDDLEVQMWRPIAIDRRRANAADLFAARHRLAGAAAFERILAEVAVEREEGRAVAGRVLQDHQRPVVQPRGVIDGQVDLAGQRRIDWRAGLDEQIDAKMDRAALVGRARAGGKGRRCIDQPRLVVAANPDGHASRAQLAEDSLAQQRRRGRAWIRAQEQAADAQIEHATRRSAQIDAQHRYEVSSICLQPGDDCSAMRHWRQPAGMAERVMGEARVDGVQLRQRRPGRRLADRNVGIVGFEQLAPSRIGDAHSQPGTDQREQQRNLGLGKRKSAVVAGHHLCRRHQRVALAEQRVGRRNRRLADDLAQQHVAEIDHADRLAWLDVWRADQQIVIVRVAVNDASAQAREHRRNLVLVLDQAALHHGAASRICDRAEMLANPAGAREIPLELTLRGGMRKIDQRSVDLPEQPANAVQQLGAMRAGLG